jgi:hypothetical protein
MRPFNYGNRCMQRKVAGVRRAVHYLITCHWSVPARGPQRGVLGSSVPGFVQDSTVNACTYARRPVCS